VDKKKESGHARSEGIRSRLPFGRGSKGKKDSSLSETGRRRKREMITQEGGGKKEIGVIASKKKMRACSN